MKRGNFKLLSGPPGQGDADDKIEPPLKQGDKKEYQDTDAFAETGKIVVCGKVVGVRVKCQANKSKEATDPVWVWTV